MMARIFKTHPRILFALGAGLALLTLAACESAQTPAASLGIGGVWIDGTEPSQQFQSYPFPVVQVSGSGTAVGTPDLATLNMAVSVTADTVAEARQTAATTMDSVITSLLANSIPQTDIATRHFSVRPEYNYGEDGREHAGYTVSNGLAVNVRAIDTVSTVIDDAITAGGDHIVFNNLNYSIADTTGLKREAREAAVHDMQDRASQLAEYAGLQLGDLSFISETPIGDVFTEARNFALPQAASADFATPTLPGQTEVTVTVFGVYDLLPAE